MKINTKMILTSILPLSVNMTVIAQEAPPPPMPPPPPGLPIDGPVLLVLILGLMYGGYKIWQLKKQNQFS